MAGIENIKKQTKVVDAFVEVIHAARADDGEVTWSDLLSRDVWDKGLDLAEVSADVADDFEAIKDELADLDTAELLEVCLHFMDSVQGFWEAVKGDA